MKVTELFDFLHSIVLTTYTLRQQILIFQALVQTRRFPPTSKD